MPATWGGVVDGTSAAKAKVLYSYKDAVANKETLAGYVPVSEDTLKDYDELLSIIQHDLLLDLNSVTDDHMFSGNNSTGIVGIKNTTASSSSRSTSAACTTRPSARCAPRSC